MVNRSEQRLIISVNAQQLRSERSRNSLNFRRKVQSHLVQQNFASQRVAVRVQTIGRQADQNVGRYNPASIKHFSPVHQTNDASGEIVFARSIHVRQLSGLAPNESATSFFAGPCESRNKLIENRRVQTLRANIVQEE